MKVLLSHDAIQARIQEMGSEIARDYAGREPHLVGVLKGACAFMTDLAQAIDLPLTLDYIAVSSYGAATKSSGEVKLVKDLDQGLEGRDLLVVEDIVDTGLTLNYLVNVLRARGPRTLKVAALLSKPSRRLVEVHVDYVGFTIEDHFVVGYGLDYNEKYRNLRDIVVYGARTPWPTSSASTRGDQDRRAARRRAGEHPGRGAREGRQPADGRRAGSREGARRHPGVARSLAAHGLGRGPGHRGRGSAARRAGHPRHPAPAGLSRDGARGQRRRHRAGGGQPPCASASSCWPGRDRSPTARTAAGGPRAQAATGSCWPTRGPATGSDTRRCG